MNTNRVFHKQLLSQSLVPSIKCTVVTSLIFMQWFLGAPIIEKCRNN